MPMVNSVTFSPSPESYASPPIISDFQNAGFINSPVYQGACVTVQHNVAQRYSLDPVHHSTEYRSTIQESFEPYLTIIEQPKTKWRYRYESEKGSHGGLPGRSTSTTKRTFPSVKLNNYSGKEAVYIKASLWTDDDIPIRHVHKLCGPRCEGDGTCIIKLNEDRIAVFQDMTILFAAKKEVAQILFNRKLEKCAMTCKSDEDMKRVKGEAKHDAKHMDFNKMKICFEALYEVIGTKERKLLCPPVFSDPVANQKSPDVGDLKICRMSRIAGSVIGGEEVFLLCTKVNKKDISVRYYEEDSDWEALASFSEADVHYQYAIVFQTPPYYRTDIKRPVNVCVQLQRPSNGDTSEPKEFTYFPCDTDDEGMSRKRKKNSSYHEFDGGNLQYGAFGIQDSYGSVQTSVLDSGDSAHGSSHGSSSNCIEHPESIDGVDSYADCDDMCSILASYSDEQLENMLDIDTTSGHLSLEDSGALIEPHKDPLLSQANVQMPKWNLSHTSGTSDMLFESTFPSIKTDSSSSGVRGQYLKEQQEPRLSSELERSFNRLVIEGQSSELEHSFDKLAISNEGSVKNSNNSFCFVNPADPTEISTRKNEHCESGKEIVVLKQQIFQKIVFSEGLTRNIWFNLSSALAKHLIHCSNKDGGTLLHLVLIHQRKDTNLIESILQAAEGLSCTPLHMANRRQQTPLHLAVLVKEPPLVKLLLQYGADPTYPDQNGCTSFHLAVNLNHKDCLQELLERKNYKNSKEGFHHLQYFNHDGFSPLHCAVNRSSIECIKLLCDSGANINVQSRKDGRTPLHFAVDKDIAIVKLLLSQEGININAQDYGGNTALHLACALKLCGVIRELMLKDANPLIRNFDNSDTDSNSTVQTGRTPHDFANEDKQIIKILAGIMGQEYGATPNFDSRDVNWKLGESVTLQAALPEHKSEKNFPSKKSSEENSSASDFRQDFEHHNAQSDSGYISGPISLLSDDALEEVCKLLDPPSDSWKDLMLFTIVDDDFQKNILKLTPASPTKSVIETFLRSGGDVEMLISALAAANLNEAQSVLKRFYNFKN